MTPAIIAELQFLWLMAKAVPVAMWVIVILIFLLFRERRSTRRAYESFERANRELIGALDRSNSRAHALAQHAITASMGVNPPSTLSK